MDLTGSGEYIDCAIVDNPSLPKDWLKKAHIGITATTGALADNHDIISLQSFSDFEVLENYDVESANAKLFEAGPANDFQGRMKRSPSPLLTHSPFPELMSLRVQNRKCNR
jgi:hypothetical protein